MYLSVLLLLIIARTRLKLAYFCNKQNMMTLLEQRLFNDNTLVQQAANEPLRLDVAQYLKLL